MLKDYLLDVMQQHEHGLYMCELPTGNGKTYDSAWAMKEYADLIGDDTKIIYLTTLNKNLPEDALRAAYGSEELYKRNVLRLRSNFDEVDGLITDKKNKALSLYFADCTALFLYDPIKNVIGDIHSGWRGTVQKIGMVAVQKMQEEYNCNPEDIICCIGPTIRQCHFQVEEDVKDLFMQAFNDESIIKVGEVVDGKQKYYIDAVKANINMMKSCGLKEENIIDSGICTVCNSDILHSYRTEKQNAGRNAAIMCLI